VAGRLARGGVAGILGLSWCGISCGTPGIPQPVSEPVPDVDGHPAVLVGVPPEILPEWLRDFQRTWLASAAKSLGLPEGYEVEWGEPTPEELEAGRAITGALLAYLGLSGSAAEERVGRDQEATEGGRWDER
jgi:hypothetical protein